jgi:hypothetical protein
VCFLEVQLILGVPARLVVPDRVCLVHLVRLLDDASRRQWRYLHEVGKIFKTDFVKALFDDRCRLQFSIFVKKIVRTQ